MSDRTFTPGYPIEPDLAVDIHGPAPAVTRGTPAPVLAEAATAANRNTDAIQALLDLGGPVRIDTPGVVYITNTLLYGDKTSIELGRDTVLRMLPGVRKPMLRSRAHQNMLTAPNVVTITWSSGMTFSVAWAGHGLVKGDGVFINGATLQPYYKGIFVVQSVTDANNVVVRCRRLPLAAPSGVVHAVKATQDLDIRGGVWDYNYDSTFATAEPDRQNLVICGVFRGRLVGVRSANTAKFAFCINACRDVRLVDCGTTTSNSDGVKCYGPLDNVHVEGFTGICGDDGISIQTKEPALYIANQPFFGDCVNVTGSRFRVDASTSLACLYSGPVADGWMDSCGFEDIQGSAPNGFRAATLDAVDRSVGSVWARGVQCDGSFQAKLDAFSCDSMVIAGLKAAPGNASGADMVLMASTFIADALRIVKPEVASPSFSTGAGHAFNLSGTCNLLAIEDAYAKNGGAGNSRLFALQAASAVKHLVISGWDSNADQLGDILATNSPVISLSKGRHGGASVLSVRANCRVNVSQCVFTNASNGVVRSNASATVDLRSDGTNSLLAGNWVVQAAGTLVCNVRGYDVSLDPLGVTGLGTASGQYLTSTRAGATNQGPAVRVAGGWVALGTGASGANTVIS